MKRGWSWGGKKCSSDVQAGVEAIGTSYFIFTLFHIFTGIQGARMKELAPALSSCIKKHQCPGLDTHCYKKCRGVQSLIVTD